MTPKSGWYVDPHNSSMWRYWDGQGWTGHTSPRDGVQQGPAGVGEVSQKDSPSPANAGLTWVGLAVVGVAVVSLVGVVAVVLNSRSVPEGQAMVRDVVAEYRAKGGGGDNGLKLKRALEDRDEALCERMESPRFTDWVGRVSGISLAGDKVGLMLDVGEDIEIGTWNNRFSDADDGTLIERGSPLYESVAQLSEGDRVVVSGTFVSDRDTCIRESSMTDYGSLRTPDFVVTLTSLEPA